MQLDESGYPIISNPDCPYFKREWRRPPEVARRLVAAWFRKQRVRQWFEELPAKRRRRIASAVKLRQSVVEEIGRWGAEERPE